MDSSESRSKIFINPDFRKAHINRNFLPQILPTAATVPTASLGAPAAPLAPNHVLPVSSVPHIHFNPAFLAKMHLQRQQQAQLSLGEEVTPEMTLKPTAMTHVNPIIKSTSRKLIRASSTKPQVVAPSQQATSLAPLVKISKNKLVRSGTTFTRATVSSVGKLTMQPPSARVVEKRYKLVNKTSQLYKLDRRPGFSQTIAKHKPTIKKYSLVRGNCISPQKVIVTDRRLLKLKRTKSPAKSGIGASKPQLSFASPNKKLVIVNINGVLYRSSANKLQLSSTSTHKPVANVLKSTSVSKERSLTIRGTRFLLDSSGTKLRKAPSSATECAEPRLARIDIGGLTYRPKTDGTFVRTDSHRARTHLSSAKQKSIHVLSSKMKKCNVPCQIYRRLGKCSAYQRGKCPKLHDPKHIIICSRFLRGECTNPDCLLSHNVSLEKMPVCHFFLEGRCDRNDCPYLHKKVSEKERICEDFLKGFCPLADKCQFRHEFACPEFDRSGQCSKAKCPYPHARKEEKRNLKTIPLEEPVMYEKGKKPVEVSLSEVEVSAPPVRRYYLGNPETSHDSDKCLSDAQKRQLKRMLDKVEKMKQGHTEEDLSANEKSGKNDDKMAGKCKEEISEMSDSENDESEDGDKRPPILRRARLGTLPSFIPI
ncbi:zinc finger CCCH domain-containing protein 3 [Uranotaenia lowii]|uniref:zinc finger CCCH domain-containing protein 3 n=1 Tax=Uranotaenia lowii TaxID=190385 RepID=UPI00247980A0|nr:zinc finger CCCH domain-containing protein 3 [Uranotaenia lowii]